MNMEKVVGVTQQWCVRQVCCAQALRYTSTLLCFMITKYVLVNFQHITLINLKCLKTFFKSAYAMES